MVVDIHLIGLAPIIDDLTNYFKTSAWVSLRNVCCTVGMVKFRDMTSLAVRRLGLLLLSTPPVLYTVL